MCCSVESLDALKTYRELAYADTRRALALQPFVDANFAFYGTL